ncbi:MAG: hypothetical protein L6R38_009145 [Xanthoria sp. 2 TBL-2021]|nr:MAG: hypothetical protein L6R38_009145 [Xanthoria sp. 2 TBL-2021]
MAKRSREDSPPAGTVDSPSTSSSPSNATRSPSPNPLDGPRSTKFLQVSDEPARASIAMKCSLAPHPETITFTTFEEFEVHYAQIHTNRCSECRKNFPTEHFLGLHISENHDPLVAARKAKEEKTYRCFVEDCNKVCSTPQKRRMHLQAKHFFPKDYDYFIVNDGIDKRSSMLRTRHRRASSAASRALHRNQKNGGAHQEQQSPLKGTDHGQDIKVADLERISSSDSPEEDSLGTSPASRNRDMEELTSTMSALKFVPPSVRFGRGGRAAGLSRR